MPSAENLTKSVNLKAARNLSEFFLKIFPINSEGHLKLRLKSLNLKKFITINKDKA